MGFFIFLRDKVVPILFLLVIIIGGLGSIGWLFARTYLWQTSEVTFITDNAVSAEMHIAARILYYDIPLFQDIYPFHITLPYQKTVQCNKECIFTDVPAGDAYVVFRTVSGEQWQEKIVILSDTTGIIDLRMPIEVQTVSSQEIGLTDIQTPSTDIPAGSIVSQNIIQGLWLWYDNAQLFLYDVASRQNILLSNLGTIRMAVRGLKDGEYYLINTKNEVVLFDRYGRQKTDLVTQTSLDNQKIIWEQRESGITSKVLIGAEERVFFGRLFWAQF